MPIRVSSNISSHGTITGESIVALAIRPRMKCMRGVWHKSRNFSVHHIVLRPLPMRQLTRMLQWDYDKKISKLPMRQLTNYCWMLTLTYFSKLPMRQLTHFFHLHIFTIFSKLPMRQLTLVR